MIKSSLKRFGLWPMVIGITVMSIVASALITAGVHVLALHTPMPPEAWFISILCPATIAPVMTWLTLHLVLELQRAQESLRLLSNQDELTSVYNRRYFMEKLREEIERSNRYGSALSVALIDVDNFKGINDLHGHISGDEVLRWLAQECLLHVRQTDVFARIGGEEFAILLPQTTRDDAVHMLERLRLCVADLRVELPETVLSITVSIGLASPTGQVSEINNVLREADEALYAAKRQGKNRIIWTRHAETAAEPALT